MCSPGLKGHGLRLHGKHQTQTCSNIKSGHRGLDLKHSPYGDVPGKMKMKKALMPPMTLMTLLISGTNTAMRRAAVIHRTVRRHRLLLSKASVTVPVRF